MGVRLILDFSGPGGTPILDCVISRDPKSKIQNQKSKMGRAVKRAAKWGLTLRWRVRPLNHDRTYRARVNGLDLVVLPTVFHPARHFTSRFLAEECARLLGRAREGNHARVLEVGTGTG